MQICIKKNKKMHVTTIYGVVNAIVFYVYFDTFIGSTIFFIKLIFIYFYHRHCTLLVDFHKSYFYVHFIFFLKRLFFENIDIYNSIECWIDDSRGIQIRSLEL